MERGGSRGYSMAFEISREETEKLFKITVKTLIFMYKEP